MAQQTIGIGAAPNDGTGDPIRTAFGKCNDNFTELYAALTGLLELKGQTDASANPNYPAASKGDAYRVSVAGKIGGASGVDVEVGDLYYALADNAGGTQASVGTSWDVLQANLKGAYVAGGTDVAVADGGTGGSTAGDARTNLDVYSKAEVDAAIAAAGGGGGGATSALVAPGGRLTLVSGTPVLTSDQTAKSAIYYTPYRTDLIPLWDGTAWNATTFAELTLTLDTTNHASGSLYDVFVWNDAGTMKIGTGPAWSSSTARGTGAGTTELQLKNGIWTNKNSITLKNGAGAGTAGIAANTATYVGTFYATAAGQTGMAFKPAAAAGGTNNILGLFNAYNRVDVAAMSRDSTSSWTYASTTWRAANASSSNRVTFVDGLATLSGRASLQALFTGSGAVPAIGVDIDSTSATPDMAGTGTHSTNGTALTATGMWTPSLGLRFVQHVEKSSGTSTFYGIGASGTPQGNALTVTLQM